MRAGRRAHLHLVFAAACSSTAPSGERAREESRSPEVICEAEREPEACVAAAELYFDGGINLPARERAGGGHPLDHARSFRYASLACEKGHAFGCALAGYHHQDGLGTDWAPERAIAAYEKACAGGAGVGCYNLATMYFGGHGVVADEVRAEAYKAKAKAAWQAACQGEAPRWCTNLAYLLREEDMTGNRARALELDERSCEHRVLVGCTEAVRDRFALGRITAAVMVTELERLCREGEPTACTVAGSTLIGGRDGLAPDTRRGMELVARGCEMGDKSACLATGFEHARGQLVARDLAAADRYVGQACDRGLGAACLALAQDRGAQQRFDEMARYARRACQMGEGEGCGALSSLYLTGQGVGQNDGEGVRWATEACRMGFVPGCAELMRRDGDLPVPPAMKKRIYGDACSAGVERACQRLKAIN